jgi:hypothetical protein
MVRSSNALDAGPTNIDFVFTAHDHLVISRLVVLHGSNSIITCFPLKLVIFELVCWFIYPCCGSLGGYCWLGTCLDGVGVGPAESDDGAGAEDGAGGMRVGRSISGE